MFRPGFPTVIPSPRQLESWTCLLAPLALWIWVTVSLQYGYYSDYRMLLGPSSSRLVKASPLFVKKIEVTDEAKKGVFIYGLHGMPELSSETNWTVSKYLIVRSYSSQGFSLWLNQGSRIRLRWEAQTSSLNHIQVVVIKGERKFETLLPNPFTYAPSISSSTLTDGKEAEYIIVEDDKYYVSVINTYHRSIIMRINVNVSSKMYDTTRASSMCSTMDGSCQLNLLFPSTQFVLLMTPNNGDLGGWYIELSFAARVVTYVAILGLVAIIIFLILKYLGACNGESDEEEIARQEIVILAERLERDEANRLMPENPIRLTYGTGDVEEDDPESGSSSSPCKNGSSDELYDGKICVICYDHPRNCFFVPCGHCATCHDCAQRIMKGENNNGLNVEALWASQNVSDGFLRTATDQSKASVLAPDPTLHGLNNSDPTALVIDQTRGAVSHNKGKPPLLSTDDLVHPDAKLEHKNIEAPVLFRGMAPLLHPVNNLEMKILPVPSSANSANLNTKSLKAPIAIGSAISLVPNMHARSTVRTLILGSLSMIRDRFSIRFEKSGNEQFLVEHERPGYTSLFLSRQITLCSSTAEHPRLVVY
ncbi:hypothetical protein Nepgr_005006 [Nepenthes gracilis]|uniref:Uncharacterized protein n=1 Tax=Nepenthes gracilis TaxID=150966 RepID=A0AAD3S2P1_NEPGR|nr:hypothetical protein Nepgr_005006 [Nepenthes gracilis]